MNDFDEEYPIIHKSHSVPGIASIVIGIVNLILMCLAFTLATNQSSILAIAWCLVLPLWLVELLLAIAGLIKKDNQRLFPILGLILIVVITIPMLIFLLYSIFGG